MYTRVVSEFSWVSHQQPEALHQAGPPARKTAALLRGLSDQEPVANHTRSAVITHSTSSTG